MVHPLAPFIFIEVFFVFCFLFPLTFFERLLRCGVDWKRQGRSVAWYELTATLQGSSNKSYELDETCMLTPSWTYRGKSLLCTSRTMETFYYCLARCLSLIKIASTPFTGIELQHSINIHLSSRARGTNPKVQQEDAYLQRKSPARTIQGFPLVTVNAERGTGAGEALGTAWD